MAIPPSAFPGDPYGHVTNQSGHYAAVGITAALAVLPWWGAASCVIVAAAYALFWEIGVQKGRLWRDSLEDTINVFCGAALVSVAVDMDRYREAWAVHVAWFVLLAIGAWRRR